MKMKKLTALLLATLMVLSLAACGAKGDSKTENSGDTAQTEEAAATHKSLMDRRERDPGGEHGALGKGLSGGGQGHGHAARTARITAISCWTPSNPPRTSSAMRNTRC